MERGLEVSAMIPITKWGRLLVNSGYRSSHATRHSTTRTMVTNSSCVSVLLAGSSAHVGKKEAISAMRKLNAVDGAKDDCGKPLGAFQTFPMSVATKYFNAELNLVVVPSSMDIAHPNLWDDTVTPCEGVILLFNLSQENSFEALAGWKDFLDEYQPSVALCVGTHADRCEPATLEKNRQQHIEWCLDNSLEYIQADCTNPLEGADDRDKDGMARVVEALQSHMWSNAVMKSSSKPSSGVTMGEPLMSSLNLHQSSSSDSPAADEAEANPEAEAAEAPGSSNSDAPKPTSSIMTSLPPCDHCGALALGIMRCGRCRQVGYCGKDCQKQAWGAHKLVCKKQQQQTVTTGDGGGDSSSAVTTEEANIEQLINDGSSSSSSSSAGGGKDLDAVERVMAQVQRVRTQGGAMSDQQRRDAAADAAMKLWSLLGDDDDESED